MIATVAPIDKATELAGLFLSVAVSSLVQALVTSFIAALFVRLSVRWVVSRRIGYWYAYWTSVIAQLLSCAVVIPLVPVVIVIDRSMVMSYADQRVYLAVLSPVIAFLVFTLVYGARFEISLRRAAVVVMVQFVLSLAAVILLIAVIVLVTLLVSLVA